jgi:hypothetical protein
MKVTWLWHKDAQAIAHKMIQKMTQECPEKVCEPALNFGILTTTELAVISTKLAWFRMTLSTNSGLLQYHQVAFKLQLAVRAV